MIFNSISFAVFLPLVFLLYWFVFNKNARTQNFLLLFSSIVFYCFADWRFLFLLTASGFLNFYLAISISKTTEGPFRKLLFYVGLFINIAILFYFKYFNFFIQSFVNLFDLNGDGNSFTPFHILLPLGISFFTFQLVGYLIDVNNEEIEPSNEILNFFTYLAYFPKLLSGPIERIQRFLPQIQYKREFNYQISVDGIFQFLWGLFKKMVIADNCTPLVLSVFSNFSTSSGSTLVVGAFLNVFAVYADFSGYSDMACGVSKLFGIQITNNFAFPFFATNISSFWQRWHISLTTWMMDYIFTPLSFLLRGIRTAGLAIAILITFIVVGLWHGPSWTYIVFGIIQGICFFPLILKGSLKISINKASKTSGPWINRIAGMCGLFLLISITFIFLRVEKVNDAFSYISDVFSLSIFTLPKLVGEQNTTLMVSIVMIISLIIMDWTYRNFEHVFSKIHEKSVLFQLVVVIIFASLIFVFGGQQQAFVYFQF